MPGSQVFRPRQPHQFLFPGRAPDVYPEGTARQIPAGATVNFQIHYSRTTGKEKTDASSVGLIFAKEPPRQISRRIDLSNHMFLIPAGRLRSAVMRMPHLYQGRARHQPYSAHASPRQIHAHRGRHPSGEKKTLLYVPAYSFNWQITYRAEDPIYLPKGTRIEVLATFDNSQNNPTNPDSTKAVRWGSASETEMMDGWIEYLDAPPKAVAAR